MVLLNINIALQFLSFVVIIPVAICGHAYNEEIQNSLNQFSYDFYVETSKLNPENSFVVSPLSTQIILGLISMAATGNTEREIFNALHMNTTDTIKTTFKSVITELKGENKDKLNVVNKIYVKDGKSYELSSDFKTIAEDSFFSSIENIDFSKNQLAAKTINNWVKKETNNKIKNLFSSDSFGEDTRTALINAIYFQGKWETPFEKSETKNQTFHINDSKTIDVEMMHQMNDFSHSYSDELDCQILRLPYDSSESSLIIFLPNKINGLIDLERKIGNVNINDILKDMWASNMFVTIPKFQIETSVDLKYIFKKLGINRLFGQSNAELNGILKSHENLYVSEAIHKAFIDVNEEGTEAAAASGVTSLLLSGPQEFTADHPFLYLLINKGNVLFCGKYLGK